MTMSLQDAPDMIPDESHHKLRPSARLYYAYQGPHTITGYPGADKENRIQKYNYITNEAAYKPKSWNSKHIALKSFMDEQYSRFRKGHICGWPMLQIIDVLYKPDIPIKFTESKDSLIDGYANFVSLTIEEQENEFAIDNKVPFTITSATSYSNNYPRDSPASFRIGVQYIGIGRRLASKGRGIKKGRRSDNRDKCSKIREFIDGNDKPDMRLQQDIGPFLVRYTVFSCAIQANIKIQLFPRDKSCTLNIVNGDVNVTYSGFTNEFDVSLFKRNPEESKNLRAGYGEFIELQRPVISVPQRSYITVTAKIVGDRNSNFLVEGMVRFYPRCVFIDAQQRISSESGDILFTVSWKPNGPCHIEGGGSQIRELEQCVDNRTRVINCCTEDMWASKLEQCVDNGNLVAAYFTADWSMASRMMDKYVDKLSLEYTDVVFLKVEIDQMKDVAKDWEIVAVPTVYLLKEERVVDKIFGVDGNDLSNGISFWKDRKLYYED